MTQTTGLLCCKPENKPNPGDVVSLSVEQATGQSGTAYTRFRRNTAEYGGSPYRVDSVSETGRSDQHGNVWLNLAATPTEGAGAASSGQAGMGGTAPAASNSDRDEGMAQAGAFNAGVTIAAALLQKGEITPEQVVGTVEHWAQRLLALRRSGVQAVTVTTSEGNGQPPQGGNQPEAQPQEQPAQVGDTGTTPVDDIPF